MHIKNKYIEYAEKNISYFYLFLLLFVYFYSVYASWWKWGDLFIDFGREIYVAWQLSEGAILYNDIYYHYGPLASLINGSMMYLFGNKISSIIYPNLLFILMFSISYYFIISKKISSIAAFLAILIFLFCNAFSHPGIFGIFNFVSPYSYDITYGFYIISIIIYLLCVDTEGTKKILLHLGIGILYGLTFLTKPEIILSSTALLFYYFLYLYQKSYKHALYFFSYSIIGAIILLSFIFFYFYIISDIDNAYFAITRAIMATFEGDISNLLFIKKVTGIDDISKNFLLLITSTLGITIFVFLSFYLYKKINSGLMIITIVIITLLIIISNFVEYQYMTRGLPFVIVFLLIFLTKKGGSDIFTRLILVWAASFSIKIFFSYIIFHYGFVLTAPALISLVICAFTIKEPFKKYLIPVLLTPVLAMSLGTYTNSINKYSSKEVKIEHSNNKIYSNNLDVSAHTTLFSYVADWLVKNSKPSDTLYVIPEGLLLNFKTNRTSGQPYTALGPHEWLLYGGSTILKNFQHNPPKYLYYVYRADENDWGCFGQREHYGLAFMNWVRSDYDVLIKINEDPSITGNFGAVLYQHKSKRISNKNSNDIE